MGNVNCNPDKLKNTRGICVRLEPDEWFAGEVPGSPGGEGCAVPTAERSAAARRRGQEGDKTPNGFLSPS